MKPKRYRRAIRILFLLVLFGIWKLSRRRDPLTAAPWWTDSVPGPSPEDAHEPEADSLASGHPSEGGRHESTGREPDEKVACRLEIPDPRYAVKWTDRSREQPEPREKRDLTYDEALAEISRIAGLRRRVYAGVKAAKSPFSQLGIYLQCLCGRDVTDQDKPHTIPGEERNCPYSGPQATPDSTDEPESPKKPSLRLVRAA